MKPKDLLAIKIKPSSSLGLNQLTRNWDLSTFWSIPKVEMVNIIVFPSKVSKVDMTEPLIQTEHHHHFGVVVI